MRTLAIVLSMALTATSLLAEPIAAGTYKGKYEGSAGASGDFQVKLARNRQSGDWLGDVSFTLSGQDVECKVTSVQVNGAKLKMVYSFDLQGTALESMIEGELSGGKLGGKYRTQVAGDGSAVDEGTWTTATAN